MVEKDDPCQEMIFSKPTTLDNLAPWIEAGVIIPAGPHWFPIIAHTLKDEPIYQGLCTPTAFKPLFQRGLLRPAPDEAFPVIAYRLDDYPVYMGRDEKGHIWWDKCYCEDCKEKRQYVCDESSTTGTNPARSLSSNFLSEWILDIDDLTGTPIDQLLEFDTATDPLPRPSAPPPLHWDKTPKVIPAQEVDWEDLWQDIPLNPVAELPPVNTCEISIQVTEDDPRRKQEEETIAALAAAWENWIQQSPEPLNFYKEQTPAWQYPKECYACSVCTLICEFFELVL